MSYSMPPDDFCEALYEDYLAENEGSDELLSYDDWKWDNAEELNENYDRVLRGY